MGDPLRRDLPSCAPGREAQPNGTCFTDAELAAVDVDALRSSCGGDGLCWAERDRKLPNDAHRPPKPRAWDGDPTSWLGTDDIERVMGQYTDDFLFLGALPVDGLDQSASGACRFNDACDLDPAQLGVSRVGVVFNLDTHDQPGSHWVALFWQPRRPVFYFFDSVGHPPPERVRAWCKRVARKYPPGTKRRLYRCRKQHQRENTECGMYAIYFLTEMLRGVPFREFARRDMPDGDVNRLRQHFYYDRKRMR